MIDKIRNNLLDEESTYIYDLRCRLSEDGDTNSFNRDIFEYYGDWLDADVSFDELKKSDVVICGAGQWGRKMLDILKIHGIEPVCMTDKRVGVENDGVEICSLENACKRNPNARFVIPTSYPANRMEIKKELIKAGIEEQSIVIPQCCANPNSGKLYFNRGIQYFDMLSSIEDEVFLDCGAFDGNTIRDCLKWGNGKIKKIISFEAIKDFYDDIVNRYKTEPRVKVYNYAVWDKEETLTFTESGGGSRTDNNGNIVVKALALDELLSDEKVTFIKMDIEGAELNALKGAEEIIKKSHPRLAISVYHKPEDIKIIPEYLLSIVPEYKFYLRHYASDECETILYALIE